MNRTDIHLRDPFVLRHEGAYYLYGTRADAVWGVMDGFDCYVSHDLEEWSGPHEVFRRPEGFWARRSYWAPECYRRGGTFYLLTTLGDADGRKSVNVLTADNPLGPFTYCAQLTDPALSCIDGTLVEQDGTTYLVYSHSLEDMPAGDMDAVALSDDLTCTVGEPFTLFSASDAPWSACVPFAKTEFGIDGPAYFSDGPFLHRSAAGVLTMLWSSWSACGYAVGQAVSATGLIAGPWRHEPEPLFAQGGHGMLFADGDGVLRYALHAPNDPGEERPVFVPVEEHDGLFALVDGQGAV